jgi:type II secretory pathway component PulK
VLVAVLAVVTVLSLAAYRFADGMTAEYAVAVRSREAAQAKAFAAGGVHHAAAMLADPDAMSGTLGNNPYDVPSAFSNVTVGPQDGPRQGGRFSILGVGDTFAGTGEGRYAVRSGPTDEAGKINLNAWMAIDSTGQALYTALLKLPNMTEEIADAVVDWLDADDSQRTNGAESAYYGGLSPAYLPRNGPLGTLDELLLVRGVTPTLLFGNDRNRNGRPDPGESDGNDFNRGLSEFLTVYGRELDVDVSGNPRARVNDDADLNGVSQALTAAVGQELSDYILAARFYGTSSTTNSGGSTARVSGRSTTSTGGTATVPSGGGGLIQFGVTVTRTDSSGGGGSGGGSQTVNGTADDLRQAVSRSLSSGTTPRSKVESFLALTNTQVTLPNPPNSPPNTPTKVYRSPFSTARIKEVLPKLLDAATVGTNFELTPRVNVLTAPPEVLAALPGLEQADVDAISAAREAVVSGGTFATDPAATTAAFLVTQANLTPSKFQAIEKYVTGRTMTYRVQSVGYFGRGGPVARAEAVIDTNRGHPRIVYFRDLTDLGRGFDLPR